MTTILLIGLGALGCRVAPLLARELKGMLILQDFDIVQEANLTIQELFTREDIGTNKAQATQAHLQDATCEIIVRTAPFDATSSLDGVDCIIDCTDSMATKLLVNDRARQAGIPLVTGAAAKEHGMAYTSLPDGPCWQCVVANKRPVDDCTLGIDANVALALACVQASLALRALTSTPERALVTVGGAMREIAVEKNPACKACRGEYTYLSVPFTLELCDAREKLHARPTQPMRLDLDALEGEVLQRYAAAVRLTLGGGTVLVHRHGLLEFENVPRAQAQTFSEKIMKKKE